MPKFYSDSQIDVDVDYFLDECSHSDIEDVIKYLKRTNRIPPIPNYSEISIPESEFENALNKLHGNWNRLTKEDEEIIKHIALKF